ncbi:hypothetical protein OS493_013600 [Desmophyllum pertusum]|uniref:Uncharacterized protein n=1 Tax=Desmophyllum pertusum TaxID=174260 RepID=A0A9X0A3K7_9CNID|nr:hypothetical protein OS493_013600 [Desmophyllum pertusum]
MTSAHDTKRHSASRASTSSTKHKHSRSKQDDCNTVDSNGRKQQQNDSNIAIISKNRITRSLGIYNKAKRSDTILRENLKQKVCKKKFEDIKSKTVKDMARVLDCSSFKIQLSSCSDSPVQHTSGDTDLRIQSPAGSTRTRSSCSSTGKYSNPDKNKVTPLRRITPQRITPQNEVMLAFKTPLQEISETLTESLRASETFHGRNYFAEVQGQLRKMYKQSSVNSQVQKIADSVGVASEVQKRCLKRKSVEESVSENTKNERTAQMVEHHPSSERHMNIPVLQIESSDVRCQQNRVLQTVPLKVSTSHSSREKSQSNKYQDKCHSGTKKETKLEDEKEHNFTYGREVQRCLFGQRDSHFSHTDVQAVASAHSSSSFDILDFLDGIDQASNLEHTQAHKGYLTPDPRLVSPPKKPTLESPTPEKIFYPHKLY